MTGVQTCALPICSRAAEYYASQKESTGEAPDALPSEMLRTLPTPGKTESFAFLEREMYDRTVLRTPYDAVRKITIESRGQTPEATRATDQATTALDWELTFASGFPAAERGELLIELLRNLLKRLDDGRGLQASGYADADWASDLQTSGLAAPEWQLTIIGTENRIWTLTVGGPVDGAPGDSRAVATNQRPDDVFLMTPEIYRSFMYRPDELVR